MEELFNIGISEETIRSMAELNPEIIEMTDKEIIEKEELLKKIGCNETQILNIISSNSPLLSKTNTELTTLFNYLTESGFKCLNILLDSNPYILNLEPFEIKDYIDGRIKNGEPLEDIIDDLDSNPYLFSEM